jgi:hypothetical protein
VHQGDPVAEHLCSSSAQQRRKFNVSARFGGLRRPFMIGLESQLAKKGKVGKSAFQFRIIPSRAMQTAE